MVRSKTLPMQSVAMLFGFELDAPSVTGDYIMVAKFEPDSVRDGCNLEMLQQIIQESHAWIQPATFTTPVSIDGETLLTVLAVHPMVKLAEVEALLDTIEEYQHLNEDLYWSRIQPIVQATWSSASIAERLEWIDGSDDPFDEVLAEGVPHGAWTKIYQDLEL